MKKVFKKLSRTQPGFTFVELMFAIVVLGTMLSITMSMVIGMLRFYAFSNQIRQNQENGRNILDTMSRDVRFGQLKAPSGNAPSGEICVLSQTQGGNKGIKYHISNGNLIKEVWDVPDVRSMDCNSFQNATTSTVNLVRMKVTTLEVTRTRGAYTVNNPNARAVIVKLGFITGNPDASGGCDVRNIYCNKLEYNTVVNLRQE